MRKRDGTPKEGYGLNLGVRQAMGDFLRATEADTQANRVREKHGFLVARPDHYDRLAEIIIDLLQADPVEGPRQLAQVLHLIEYSAWLKQDRLHMKPPMNDEELAKFARDLEERVRKMQGSRPAAEK